MKFNKITLKKIKPIRIKDFMEMEVLEKISGLLSWKKNANILVSLDNIGKFFVKSHFKSPITKSTTINPIMGLMWKNF